MCGQVATGHLNSIHLWLKWLGSCHIVKDKQWEPSWLKHPLSEGFPHLAVQQLLGSDLSAWGGWIWASPALDLLQEPLQGGKAGREPRPSATPYTNPALGKGKQLKGLQEMKTESCSLWLLIPAMKTHHRSVPTELLCTECWHNLKSGLGDNLYQTREEFYHFHYTAVWTLGQSFMPCHIKLAATNIMELNELPVDAGEMLLDPACWQGKMPWTGETCVISVDYKASCNLKAVKRHKKSCFDIFFHCLLLLVATIWNIPHFLPSVQVPNMSRELGTKFKGRSRGCLGSHLISNFTLCSKVEDKISRQTSPAVLQHL